MGELENSSPLSELKRYSFESAGISAFDPMLSIAGPECHMFKNGEQEYTYTAQAAEKRRYNLTVIVLCQAHGFPYL
jgi:hypothetical protein